MSEEPGYSKRTRLQGAGLLLLVFIVGGLIGGAAERVRLVRRMPPRAWIERGGRPSDERGILPRPFEQLDLSQEQRDRIVAILEARRPLTDSIMMETMPRLAAIRDSVSVEIKRILTAEQLEQLEQEMGSRLFPPDRFLRPPLGKPDLPDTMRRFH